MFVFTGLNEAICDIAWMLTLPTITAAYNSGDGITNKLAGTGIVLDPWSGDVIFQKRVASDVADPEKYDTIALAKAAVTYQTGLPSRVVQQSAPHLYTLGMTKWGGSAIENKLITAFSGVQAVFDEAIAKTHLAWIIAICQNEMTRQDGVMASESSFIGL